MELVRAESVGCFNNRLFVRLLTSALTNASVKPEVCAFLFGKYLSFADVRYYALRCVTHMARRHAVRAAPAAAAAKSAAGGGDEDVDVADEAAGQLPAEDLARNLFDLLSQLPASVPSDPSELTSWCGSAEVGSGGGSSTCTICTHTHSHAMWVRQDKLYHHQPRRRQPPQAWCQRVEMSWRTPAHLHPHLSHRPTYIHTCHTGPPTSTPVTPAHLHPHLLSQPAHTTHTTWRTTPCPRPHHMVAATSR